MFSERPTRTRGSCSPIPGGWTNPAMLTRAVQSFGRKAGDAAMTVRSLRHFHASLMLQHGQNVVVVSKRLGHANVSMTTDIYAHALPGWQREAVDAFAAAMEEEQGATKNADRNADI